MISVAIYSDNPDLVKCWSHALVSTFDIYTAHNIQDLKKASVAVVDLKKIDDDGELLTTLTNHSARLLIVGEGWPENKQINALIQGAAGYCGESEPPKLLQRAVAGVVKGDIWIQRHLVPRVIGALVKMKPKPIEAVNNADSIECSELLSTLSVREKDVANMISSGENNKVIAASLDISERTVKAHLTSIFKKLNIADRLHLALYIKDFG